MINSETYTALYTLIKRFRADVSGSTAIEYGLIGSLIGVLVITGGASLGGAVDEKFTAIADALSPRPDVPNTNSIP
ncbi:MAG: Flp family type IVb pilin [Litorimonas sp.]